MTVAPIAVMEGSSPKPARRAVKASCSLCGGGEVHMGSLAITLPLILCKRCRVSNKIVIPKGKP